MQFHCAVRWLLLCAVALLSGCASIDPQPAVLQVTLTAPDGRAMLFMLQESGAMPPTLAARYPAIHSYMGRDDGGRRVRLDMFGSQMYAMVFDPDGDWFIQPVAGGKPHAYQAFWLRDWKPGNAVGVADFDGRSSLPPGAVAVTGVASATQHNGRSRHNYRIAISATSSFTALHGGTVAGGLAGIVRNLNRVNEIYGTELGVHFTLQAENDRLVFSDPATDPFAANDTTPNIRNIEIQAQLIGADNLDLGLVMTNTYGGIAGPAAACQIGRARNATQAGLPNAAFDPYLPRILAHEIGHQFGAKDNYSACERDDEVSGYEVGHGTTIMSYAGNRRCLANAPEFGPGRPYAEHYFHAENLEQMQKYIASIGGSCASPGTNMHYAPMLQNADIEGPDSISLPADESFTIPAHTPFALAVTASELQTTAHATYTWDQMDAGPSPRMAPWDSGRGPLFSSQAPTFANVRMFPSLPVVLGTQPATLGDTFPGTNRDLNFRVTVRDNAPENATTASHDIAIRVVDTGQQFAVSPILQQPWKAGQQYEIAWNVAATDRAPINCGLMNVHLSLDDAQSFLPQSLAFWIPNNGVATITVPALSRGSDRARLKLSCAENLFFAISAPLQLQP